MRIYAFGREGATVSAGTTDRVGVTEGQRQPFDSQWLAEWRDEVYAVSQQLQRTSPWRLVRCRRLRAEWRRLGDQLDGVRARTQQPTADVQAYPSVSQAA
jgi:hypothetical protein